MEPLAIVVGVVILILAITGMKIVKPYEKGLIERLGKYQRTVSSGLSLIIPIVENIKRVDMREQVVDVPPQDVITKDNVSVTVDAVVYYEATDPVKLKYNVANFTIAAVKLAQTNLRNVVGDMALDESLTSREVINTKLRTVLDDATDKWGVRIVRVEIQRIEPPPDVTEAMHRQMKAERDKRAVVLESEGHREAAIKVADGQREAAILEATGQAEAIRRVAEANKFKLTTVADGEAEAITKVYDAIHRGRPTRDLIAIKYLETLRGIADGQATKIFLPYEATAALGGVAAISEIWRERAGSENPPAAPPPDGGAGAA
ncbi:MAG: SPFH domain-containing protein [bacterium]|jgi:regulator of protease activity HflC (stomatin/prohibitin superfamily)